jgi:pyruvate carboxylase subunit A
LGIKSVAIYTDADRHALHVKKADEAYHIGKDPILGYLNAHTLVNLAAASGCDALHPGYGFLSENPDLATICARRGIRFIGPSPEVIRSMGDKIQASNAMIAAGIPVVPGSDHNLENVEEARALANKFGYPVMLKATNGGGGRGIRRCDSEEELLKNYDRVVSEASKAFGKPEVFVEKCVVRPKHIEVQILGDTQGNVIHLFERDCSIQRRNQKLIEIAPSPQLTEAQRQYIGKLAVRAAKSVGYVNAGTVEFLLDQDNQFYFMEMNTRLQVEHPITETITGVDIVQEQIRIASGLPLQYKQDENQASRLCDRIPHQRRRPEKRVPAQPRPHHPLLFAGRPRGARRRCDLHRLRDPALLRLDVRQAHGVEPELGSDHRARPPCADDMLVYGVKTTIPYYQEILKNPEFRSGRFNTSFVDEHPELTQYTEKKPPEVIAAAIAAAIAAHQGL